MEETEVSNLVSSLAKHLAHRTHLLVSRACSHNPHLHPYNSPGSFLRVAANHAAAPIINNEIEEQVIFPAQQPLTPWELLFWSSSEILAHRNSHARLMK